MICVIENIEQFEKLLKKMIDKAVSDSINKMLNQLEDKAPKSNDDLIDNEAAAKIFNVTLQTLYNWRKKGVIKFIKTGGKVYYSREEISSKIKGLSNNFR
jgi:hypothetical protein